MSGREPRGRKAKTDPTRMMDGQRIVTVVKQRKAQVFCGGTHLTLCFSFVTAEAGVNQA